MLYVAMCFINTDFAVGYVFFQINVILVG